MHAALLGQRVYHALTFCCMLQLLRVQHRMQCHGQLQSRQPVCRLVTESNRRALGDRRCLTFRDSQISKQTAHRLIQAQSTYSMTLEVETPRKVVYKLGVTGSIGMLTAMPRHSNLLTCTATERSLQAWAKAQFLKCLSNTAFLSGMLTR